MSSRILMQWKILKFGLLMILIVSVCKKNQGILFSLLRSSRKINCFIERDSRLFSYYQQMKVLQAMITKKTTQII